MEKVPFGKISFRGHGGKPRMTPEEILHHLFVLFPQERAGGIDQPSSFFDEGGSAFKDVPLFFLKLADRFLGDGPLHTGIAPDRAESAAGSVKKHDIERPVLVPHEVDDIPDLP